MLSQNTVEINIGRVYVVSRASLFLPFSVEDAARSEAEVEASQVPCGVVPYRTTDRGGYVRVSRI